MKKFTAVLLALVLTAFSFCFSASAAQSGNFGNLTWRLEDGVLTVSGEGAMEDLSFFEASQWRLYALDITSVVIEEGVTSIGNVAFLGCDNLTSISLPEGITSIGEYAFQSCDSLAEINLPQSLTTLMSGAFSMCASLKEITVPEAVTTFEEAVFEACTSLETVDFRCTLSTVPPFTFDGCTALKTVRYAGTEEEWSAITASLAVGNDALLDAEIEFGGAMLGDVNGDGVTDNLDAAYVLRHNAMLITLTGDALTLGDVSGDGTVNSLDAALILKYDAGLIEGF